MIMFSANEKTPANSPERSNAAADVSPAGSRAVRQARSEGNLAAPASNLTGMPDQLKANVESLSGHDLSDVRVYYQSPEPASLNALAYAQGNDIHLAPGQEQHLPHEAWHVVQQREGRVQPTLELPSGIAVNNDSGLEKEADDMGARVS